MTIIRILIISLGLYASQLMAVTSNINVQFLLSDSETGVMEGQYKIVFSLLLNQDDS